MQPCKLQCGHLKSIKKRLSDFLYFIRLVILFFSFFFFFFYFCFQEEFVTDFIGLLH